MAARLEFTLGSVNSNFYALNPDVTKKWRFTTGEPVQSSPASAPDDQSASAMMATFTASIKRHASFPFTCTGLADRKSAST